MFRAPRKLDSEPELYDTAVRALMRRAHSVHEMKKSLERRTDDKAMVKSVLDRLKRQGMIDDARYAKQFTRQRAEIRKQGKFRIARELRARGIPDRHIDSALEESAKETDERAVVRHRIEKSSNYFAAKSMTVKSLPCSAACYVPVSLLTSFATNCEQLLAKMSPRLKMPSMKNRPK